MLYNLCYNEIVTRKVDLVTYFLYWFLIRKKDRKSTFFTSKQCRKYTFKENNNKERPKYNAILKLELKDFLLYIYLISA